MRAFHILNMKKHLFVKVISECVSNEPKASICKVLFHHPKIYIHRAVSCELHVLSRNGYCTLSANYHYPVVDRTTVA